MVGNNATIGKIIHLVINLSTTLFKKYNILFNILSPIFVLLCPFLLRNKGSNYNSDKNLLFLQHNHKHYNAMQYAHRHLLGQTNARACVLPQVTL